VETSLLAILVAVSFATSVLSGILGMAGGMVLLSVMLLFLDPLEAIPLHGVIQLVSNASRGAFQREHIDTGIVWRYALPLLPMGFAGLVVAQSLSPAVTKALIGAFVLLATWAPGLLLLGAHPERSDRNRRFLALGTAVGLLNVTVGATGPLIAPFFLNLGLSRHQIIGTKAACQTLGHLAKLVVFGAAGFAFLAFALPLAMICATGIAGTWLGTRILGRVSELWFTRLYKAALTLIALHLLLFEGIARIASG
jgi:uncharacterized membrane protein YfcA